MRILVTGGAGFIGHHLVGALVERGDEVVVLDDLETGDLARLDPLRPALDVRIGDVRDADAVAGAMIGCAVVVHLAAIPSAARSMDDPDTTISVNRDGTAVVMDQAVRHGVRRVIHAGSSSVYGDAPGFPRRESQTPAPRSPYARSKLEAEAIVHEMGAGAGIGTVALRYFNVFGPGQDPASRYAAVVPRCIVAALRDEPMIIHGDGRQTRDFTFVSDVVAANLLAIDADVTGLTANVGGGAERSLLDLVAGIERATGRRLRVRHDEPRPGDVRRSLADTSLARRTLGYRVAVPFEAGLERTVAAYRDADAAARDAATPLATTLPTTAAG